MCVPAEKSMSMSRIRTSDSYIIISSIINLSISIG